MNVGAFLSLVWAIVRGVKDNLLRNFVERKNNKGEYRDVVEQIDECEADCRSVAVRRERTVLS